MERENRGARLKVSSDMEKVEPLSFLRPDGTFSAKPDLKARVGIVDRFLSNFHKPLQRRMMYTKPGDPMPPTFVLRHDITNQVYIVGQERLDSDGVSQYERLNVLHLVSNESSTYVEVFKYAKPDGADPDSMLLERESIGRFYISLEYQSSRTESYSDREQSSRMLFYSSADFLSVADELCEFEYNNKIWSIKQVFYDSGFASGTLIDSGQNIETYQVVKPVNQYDPTTGEWDFLTGATLIPFSASLGEDDGDTSLTNQYGSSNEKTLYVKAQFEYAKNFKVGTLVQFPDGATFRVDKLRNNRRSSDIQLTLSRIISSTP